MCVHMKYVCAETMNSAESVIIRVFDQHLCVLLQPRKGKNATFLFSHHVCMKRWSTACLTAKRTAGGAGATGCRTSSRPSSQSGSERRRPGPSSAPAGSGHRRWAAPRRCPSRPETRHSCSGARSPDGRSSTRNACGRESHWIVAETVDGVKSHTSSIWILVDEKWVTLKRDFN